MTVDYTKPPVVPPPPPPPQQPQQPQQKSSGCFKWGCLGCSALFLLGCAGIAVVVFIAFAAIRQTEVYRGAVHRVRQDPRVAEAIGRPIGTGWWIAGTVDVNESSGRADFTFPVRGPHGHGTVHTLANRESGNWVYNELTFTPSNGPPIDLLKP